MKGQNQLENGQKHPLLRVAIAVLIVIIVIAAIIFVGLHPYADQVFLSPTEENKRKFDVSLTIVQAITSSVGTLAAIFSGIFLYLNFTVAEDKQIAERFAKAVEQLGNNQLLQVRLGGIYSLERIAKNSYKDLWTVVEVLSSFIREYAAHRAKDPSSVEVSLQFQAANGESRIKLPTDVQAAFTVLDRIYKKRTVDQRIDFQGIDLSNTLLLKINLSGGAIKSGILD